ncbi:hypothetical protein RHOSPDRAFT_34456 [Rhodotorula sp. JG-1b]|nr:hypothetical protein RHOSPDRAFT_34456 [Rhodotorula sp. JG-1b]
MPADESAPAARPAPLPTSCQTCRLRKIRCQPSEDGGDQCQPCRKKGINCVFVERSRTRRRSGKNVEAARERYGSVVPGSSAAFTSSSSSSSSSVSPPSIASEDSLVQHHLASSFGAKLFDLWLDRRQTRTNMPNVDLPVVDFWELLDKFNGVGQRLDRLPPSDELLCRITYSFAAPLYLPDRLAGNSRRDISNRLLQEAEGLADSLHIWRKLELAHVASLLLLSRAKGTASCAGNDSMPYLSAAVAQFRQLTRRTVANLEEREEPLRRLGWSLIVADVFGAAELQDRPQFVREELAALLSGCSPSLPTSEELLAAARISGDESLSRILQAVQVVVLVAHDTATYTATDAFSLEVTTKIWLRLDEVYGWARNTLFAVYAPELVGHGLIRIYAHVLWVAALALETSLMHHLSDMITRVATSNARACSLKNTELLANLATMCGHANQRLARSLCALLRLPQEQQHCLPLHAMSIVSGVVCSVARVLDLAAAFAGAPVSDTTLFPLGALDKLVSLRHLSEQIRYLSRGYPSAQMTATLDALNAEEVALGGSPTTSVLDLAVSDLSSNLSSFDPHTALGSPHAPQSGPNSIVSSPWLADQLFSDHSLLQPLHTSSGSLSPAEEWRWELV